MMALMVLEGFVQDIVGVPLMLVKQNMEHRDRNVRIQKCVQFMEHGNVIIAMIIQFSKHVES